MPDFSFEIDLKNQRIIADVDGCKVVIKVSARLEWKVVNFLFKKKGIQMPTLKVAKHIYRGDKKWKGKSDKEREDAAGKVFERLKGSVVDSFSDKEVGEAAWKALMNPGEGYCLKGRRIGDPLPPVVPAARAWPLICREMFARQRLLLRRSVTRAMAESRMLPVAMPLECLVPGVQNGVAPHLTVKAFVEEWGKSKSLRVAIVGEPGAGKSTSLAAIAQHLLASPETLAVLVAANEVGKAGLADHLHRKWCPKAFGLESADAAWRELRAKLGSGAWLFVDGIDEGSDAEDPLARLDRWLSELTADMKGNLRIVVSCRQAVWLRDHHRFQPFDAFYRPAPPADFAAHFVSRWYEAAGVPADSGALDRAARLGTFAMAPLILALVCEIGDSDGERLITRGLLMERAAIETYAWRRVALGLPPSPDRLRKSVARLARESLDTSVGQAFAAEDAVGKLEESSDLVQAVAIGWLRYDAAGKVEFGHALWLDYFAAVSIENWRQDLLPPVVPHAQELPCRYRVFESGWREAVLLWIGFDPHRDALLEALSDFDDGMMGLYGVEALLLAAEGMAEAPEFRGEKVIERLLDVSKPWRIDADAAIAGARTVSTRAVLASRLKEQTHVDTADCRLRLAELLLKVKPRDSVALGHLRTLSADTAFVGRLKAIELILMSRPGDPDCRKWLFDLRSAAASTTFDEGKPVFEQIASLDTDVGAIGRWGEDIVMRTKNARRMGHVIRLTLANWPDERVATIAVLEAEIVKRRLGRGGKWDDFLGKDDAAALSEILLVHDSGNAVALAELQRQIETHNFLSPLNAYWGPIWAAELVLANKSSDAIALSVLKTTLARDDVWWDAVRVLAKHDVDAARQWLLAKFEREIATGGAPPNCEGGTLGSVIAMLRKLPPDDDGVAFAAIKRGEEHLADWAPVPARRLTAEEVWNAIMPKWSSAYMCFNAPPGLWGALPETAAVARGLCRVLRERLGAPDSFGITAAGVAAMARNAHDSFLLRLPFQSVWLAWQHPLRDPFEALQPLRSLEALLARLAAETRQRGRPVEVLGVDARQIFDKGSIDADICYQIRSQLPDMFITGKVETMKALKREAWEPYADAQVKSGVARPVLLLLEGSDERHRFDDATLRAFETFRGAQETIAVIGRLDRKLALPPGLSFFPHDPSLNVADISTWIRIGADAEGLPASF